VSRKNVTRPPLRGQPRSKRKGIARTRETPAEVEARMMREYTREYLMRWHTTVLHIIGHLAQEAEQMEVKAASDPLGAFAGLGMHELSLYALGLDQARTAIGDMKPPIITPIFLSNVVDDLAELRRTKPWEGGEA
jgi:hypothetical protein